MLFLDGPIFKRMNIMSEKQQRTAGPLIDAAGQVVVTISVESHQRILRKVGFR